MVPWKRWKDEYTTVYKAITGQSVFEPEEGNNVNFDDTVRVYTTIIKDNSATEHFLTNRCLRDTN